MKLNAEPLTADAFAAFGSVFSAPAAPGRSAPVAELLSDRAHATPTLTVSLEDPPPLPVIIRCLEQHPFSTQTFIPLDLSRYLLVVAPTLHSGHPSLAEARAFVGGATQGVSYVTGLWHAAFMVLDRRGSYAALIWRDGTAADEVFIDLPPTLTIAGLGRPPA
jgi:ureidoglycolate lyase